MSNYDWLISKLDAFIRKYYANKVIKGSLIFLSCLLSYILMVSLGEYYLYMPVWLRVTADSLFILLGLSALVVWVVVPLSKMARLGNIISHEQAATIVGQHFPEISDKLLNILQLKKHADPNASRALVEASIDQKAGQLWSLPIGSAIDYSKNKKYLRFLLPILLVGIFILVAAPNVFRDASDRLLQPTKSFEKPAPFQFIIKNIPLQTVRNADLVLKVEVKGAALPNELSIELGSEKVPMQVLENHNFQYTFRNVTDDVHFRLFAAGYYSQPYTLKVVQKPVLKAFKIAIDYPAYIGRKNEVRNSLGDMTLPVGTTVHWAFVAEHTDEALVKFGDGSAAAIPGNNSIYGFQYRFMNDTSYTFTLRNKQANVTDSYHYSVQVIPDQYPVLQVQEFRDTVSGKQILLSGTAGDDYGITKVLFHYKVTNNKDDVVAEKAMPVKATAGALTSFQQYFDIESLDLKPGQKVSYYIEAWDNDGVHGSKASRSEMMSYSMFNPKQLDSAINANAQQINSGLSNSAEQTQQMRDDFKEMQNKMLQSQEMDWQQKQQLQDMMDNQMKLQTQVENAKKRFEEQVQQSKQKNYSDDLKDKQEELKKQMDNLLNNELKEQMKKLQELMQQLNKDKAFQAMQQMEQENKLFDMDLKRMQELMKKLEMQMRMEDMANKMNELAQKEDQLQKETDKGKKDADALSKEQEAIKKELDSAMAKGMKDMDGLNDQMKEKQQLDKPKEQGKQAQQNMQKSQQQLGSGQKSKASESEQQAAQNLQDMANSLMAAAGGMNIEEIDADIKTVRQMLTNLIRLSFDQEKLMKSVQWVSPSSKQYIANQQEQNRLRSNSIMIRDSLYKMSLKSFKLTAFINKETTELEKNMGMTIDALEARHLSDAMTRQQYIMTNTNNLALMLNETLSNLMQMQSQAKKPGAGMCNKPGGMNPKPGASGKQLSDIITQQQNLGNAMQQMENALQQQEGKQGSKQNGSKDGQSSSQQQKQGAQQDGENGNAEQIAMLAAQQAAIRRQLEDLSKQLNGRGGGNSKELRELQEKMDRTETDLVNRRLGSELIQRQKEIMTRLLEAEKALREQDQDNKRSSRTAQEMSRPIPPELQKYMQDRQKLLELYKTVPPQLKPYYRNMVEQYYQLIGSK
jgi:hypothetical protein